MEIIQKSLGNTQKGSIIIQSGCYLKEVIQMETAGNKVIGGISYGSSDGGVDIIGAFNMDPNDKTRLSILGYYTPDIIYFDAVTDWNDSSVDIYLILGSLTE